MEPKSILHALHSQTLHEVPCGVSFRSAGSRTLWEDKQMCLRTDKTDKTAGSPRRASALQDTHGSKGPAVGKL